MNPQEQKAIILKLLNTLKQNGSWCGETHIQKAAFCLNEITRVPLIYTFILYKHGPFSFDLRDELSLMHSDELIDIKINPSPYGPSLQITPKGEKYMERFSKILQTNKKQINFIGEVLGPKGVAELERLATALYITRKENTTCIKSRVSLINKIKPHISINQANDAVEIVDELLRTFQTRITMH
jgi:hypothetical protein